MDSAGTDTATIITRVWADLFQKEDIAADDNFFALGGDSMAMVVMQFRLSEELGMEVPLPALLENPGLADFCRVIDTLRVAPGRATSL